MHYLNNFGTEKDVTCFKIFLFDNEKDQFTKASSFFAGT